MWLINTASLVLEFVEDPETCVYAILSHTWGDGEVSFQDMANIERARKKLGFSKIERTCQLALNRNIEYAWVDTCCIDKSSSAELTEAINSMFRWYKQSHICFVFLSDLLSIDRNVMSNDLPHCRWFTRGWTLQELIAPENIEFYNWGWDLIGTKVTLRTLLSEITGIYSNILNDSDLIFSIPVARRMSWAASRQTTRVEDLAYCLFGIFDVNLPLIYGEGKKSFIRLQEAIARETNDLSLFAWTSQKEDSIPTALRRKFRGILAESPVEFKGCGDLRNLLDPGVLPAQVSITNQGINITDRLSDSTGEYLLNLDCNLAGGGQQSTIVIRLVRTPYGFVRQYSGNFVTIALSELNKSATSSLPIPKTISLAGSEKLRSELRWRFSVDFTTDIPSLDVKIQRKPLHLWDQVTQTFITCGSPDFTGVIELSATWNIRGHKPGFWSSAGTFVLVARPILIFGLQHVWKPDTPTVQSTGRLFLEPWAGLYTDRGPDETSHALSDLLSKEHTHGFPHVAREARRFVLSRAFANGKQQNTCEHHINPHLVGSGSVAVSDPRDDKWVQSTLTVETKEMPEFTVHYMRLNLKNPLGTGWKP
ncbi:Heterokaryon incompatibility protein (HET) domain containing protein [Hyaloscypha variabilis]